ncbi:hypothetical protein IFM46972_11183 [Aspergillus udagawae]|uniref:Uncharacterized protein n=1 Tax=Aspergillus udagawae TaxID=91492 RepID=A0A8H3SG46_9EURO|nr:hypothetical protein IFM46972_11183 [Aspergillus udagawae]
MTAASSTTDVETAPEKDVKDIKDEISTPKESEYRPLPKVIVIILALYLAVFLVALGQTIIGVAIPQITDQFKRVEETELDCCRVQNNVLFQILDEISDEKLP